MSERQVQHSFRQLKLTNGDEIVADVYQWNDDDHDEVVVKNAMKLNLYEGPTGEKFFSFRPWMVYQEQESDLLVLLARHIISIAIPIEPLLVQYRAAVSNMHDIGNQRLQGSEKDMSLDQLQQYTRETMKKLKDTMADLDEFSMELDNMPSLRDAFDDDSDGGGNVIDMFTKKTIH